MEWGRIWKRRSHRERRKDGAGGRHLALETSFPLHHRHVRKKGAWPRSSDGVRSGTAVFSEEYKPEVVSFWDQWEWQAIKREFNLNEVHFTQKSLGGEATKPTTLGTSLELSPEDFQVKGAPLPGGVRSSKDLARWPPGLMRMLACAIKEQTFQSKVQLAPMSWDDHIRFGHVPYRKDCKTCQETLQQQELIVVLEIYKLELCLWMSLALSSQPMTLEDIKPGGF